MRISDSYILKTPADCSFQIDGKICTLGTYDDEADAARAFDRVARVLGRPLNFSGNDGVEVAEGPRSEGADQLVAHAVEAAEVFMDKQAAEKAKKVAECAKSKPESSEYRGVYPNFNKWHAQIKVSQDSENI